MHLIEFFDLYSLLGPTERNLLVSLEAIFSRVRWQKVFSVMFFFALIFVAIALIYLTLDRETTATKEGKQKHHYLRITNSGNVPCYFLLRITGLPNELISWSSLFHYPLLTIRKPVYGDPIIENKEKASEQEQKLPKADAKLIPNLNDPFNKKAANQPLQTVKNTQKRISVLRRLISSIAAILPDSLRAKIAPLEKGAAQVQNTLTQIEHAPTSAESKIKLIQKNASDLIQLSGSGPFDLPTNLKALSNTPETKDAPKRVIKEMLTYEQTPLIEPGCSLQIEVNFQTRKVLYKPASFQYRVEIITVPQNHTGELRSPRILDGTLHMDKQSNPKRVLYHFLIVAFICLLIGFFAFIGNKLF